MKKKTIALFLALALVVGCAIGGTVAWLTASTTPVVNTFTVGDIDITLTETTTDYKMVPGNTIAKDPKVTVKANSEACWLFVKVEKSTNFDSYLTYAMADGWIQLKDTNGKDVSGVYYREVTATAGSTVIAADTSFDVLKDNKVTVSGSLTKTEVNAITTNPTLTFTAYASQLYKDGTNKFTPAEAWSNVNSST